jgi:hypothetical protein
VLAHGGMGYAQEYHVERYLRECLVPRIAPVSRVSEEPLLCAKYSAKQVLGDDHELRCRESVGTTSKLLSITRNICIQPLSINSSTLLQKTLRRIRKVYNDQLS